MMPNKRHQIFNKKMIKKKLNLKWQILNNLNQCNNFQMIIRKTKKFQNIISNWKKQLQLTKNQNQLMIINQKIVNLRKRLTKRKLLQNLKKKIRSLTKKVNLRKRLTKRKLLQNLKKKIQSLTKKVNLRKRLTKRKQLRNLTKKIQSLTKKVDLIKRIKNKNHKKK